MTDTTDHERDLLWRLRQALAQRYAVERVMAQGGMGTVYLARDTKHAHRAVALKLLRPELAGAFGAERFLAEIRIAALLNHPHIVPVFDSGEADGLLYYVMPLVEGETLRERQEHGPPLGIDEIVRIGTGVAAALSYAHQHDVLHRDVKPENIILSGGEAILTDFGIACALRAAGAGGRAGEALGTPGYVSPEQAAGAADVDARADLYGLGAVLYELIVGSPPRSGATADEVTLGRMLRVSPEARARLDAVPPGLEAALVRALALRPADRFASAAELSRALRLDDLPARPVDRWSVAILPFAHLSAEAGDTFLGDGLAEEITNALARLRTLRVASRTSAFAYRERHVDIRQIGRDLGVGAVLEGSVRRADDALRVTVQLIDVASGYHLWSERYDRPMRDVFAVQDEIARGVVQALRGALTETERQVLARSPTTNVTAYESYLRGRQYFHQSRKKSLEYARQMFRRAIELDPGYALAYAGIADCSSLLHMYYPSAAPELEQADEASRRALELGPDLPAAHAARGFALFQLGRTAEAAAEFQTAIRLDPGQTEARYFYARQCFQQGQMEEAAHWFEEAARIDDNFEARFFAAQAREAAGSKDQAREAYAAALAAAERQLELHPDDPRAATMRAVSLCRLGQPAAGLEWARRALEIDPTDAGVRYNVACLYALEGRADEALACLGECVRLGFANAPWIARDPDLASLHGEPRFEQLLAGVGVPPAERPGAAGEAARPAGAHGEESAMPRIVGILLALLLGALPLLVPHPPGRAAAATVSAAAIRVPPPPVPDDDPLTEAKVQLGRQLFFDTRLSADNTVSCATCHDPRTGWANPHATDTGIRGRVGARNSGTIVNAAHMRHQFWDGRAASLEEQALGPIQNPLEMGESLDHVVRKLNAIPGYRAQFEEIFRTGATPPGIAEAIASFERTVVSGPSPYDRWRRGDHAALTGAAVRGERLFRGKALCATCHGGEMFTDQSFHNLGVGMDRPNPDLGRYAVTRNPDDRGCFKTPGLRNVALTPPYLHDGSERTLLDVVAFYARGGVRNENLDPVMMPLGLTPRDQADLVAFLEALTGPVPEVEIPVLPAGPGPAADRRGGLR